MEIRGDVRRSTADAVDVFRSQALPFSQRQGLNVLLGETVLYTKFTLIDTGQSQTCRKAGTESYGSQHIAEVEICFYPDLYNNLLGGGVLRQGVANLTRASAIATCAVTIAASTRLGKEVFLGAFGSSCRRVTDQELATALMRLDQVAASFQLEQCDASTFGSVVYC